MRIWQVVAVMLSMAAPVHAEAIVEGVGVKTCAQFAKNYQSDPENVENAYIEWAFGFLSGMNMAMDVSGNHPRDLAEMTFESMKSFMREYCDAHPLQPYMAGVLHMEMSLPLIPAGQPK